MANEVAIAARCEIEVRDIEYQRQSGAALLARLYRPIGDGPFPALVEVHGGAWASGDRLNNAPLAKSGEKGNARLVETHDAYRALEAEMAEGNPQLILERGEAATPAIRTRWHRTPSRPSRILGALRVKAFLFRGVR